MITTWTGCGDHQSGDPSGKCYDCRLAEPGYGACLDARIVDGMSREHEAHPDWKVRQPRTVAPGRGIGDPVVDADCPGCGWAVPAGFVHDDPGAGTREPRPCGPCQQAELTEAPEVPEAPARVTEPAATEVPEPAQPKHDQPEMELSA